MKFLKIIYYIFIVFVAVIAFLLLVSAFPITGNIKFLIVQSGSMEPAIKMGSIVMVKPVDEYKIGDVVSFSEAGKSRTPTTHRIHDMKVAESKVFYITKGDANNAPDRKEIQEKDIIGKALINIPYLGYAVDFMKKPLGFLLMIITPVAVIIFGEIKKIYEETKKKTEK